MAKVSKSRAHVTGTKVIAPQPRVRVLRFFVKPNGALGCRTSMEVR